MYNFDLIPIIKRNLIVKLRKPRMISWILNLCYPLVLLRDEFAAFRTLINDQYKYNGTVHSMECMLNDKYDPVLRRIYIIVHDNPLVSFAQNSFEQPSVFAVPAYQESGHYAMTAEEFNAVAVLDYEFTIRVWPSINIDFDEALELVNRYRWAGKRPRIIWYGEAGPILGGG